MDSWDDVLAAATALAAGPQRRVLGITGAPGAGKSVLASALANALGERACLAGMDGFHLANAELARLGRRDRKGAPDTFDAAGYVNLLRRLRSREEPIVYAPRFDRSLEEPIACAVPIPRHVHLVITEGNYLLLDDPEWTPVAGLLDECWFVDAGEDLRLQRLVERHMAYGLTPEQARERSYGSDQRNAVLIDRTRLAASRIVVVPVLSEAGVLT